MKEKVKSDMKNKRKMAKMNGEAEWFEVNRKGGMK